MYFAQYIGSKETDKRADEIQRLGIFDFWTPENHYRWSKSRYGGHVSAIVEPVDHSHLLLCSMFLQMLASITSMFHVKSLFVLKLPLFSDQDVGELERFRSRKKELDETAIHLDESLKSLQMVPRQAEDEEAKLQRQRVSNFVYILLYALKEECGENYYKL